MCDSAMPRDRGAVDPVLHKEELAIRDVDFVVGRDHGQEKIFSASKAALASVSPVFHAIFYGGSSEPAVNMVQVPDALPDAFSHMLSHVQCREDPLPNLSAHNVFATMNVAMKYQLPALLQHCSEFVSHSLRASNCLLFLDNAVRWDAKDCLPLCLEMVDAYSEVLFLDDFAALELKTLVLVLRRNTLTADEDSVYKAAESWAFAACSRNNLDPSPANRRQVLGDAFRLIRFPLLTDALLTDASMELGLLSQDELAQIYCYKNATTKPSLPFPTAPRQPPVIRVAGLEFKHKEPVFVDRNAEYWLPAEVIAASPPHVVVSLCDGCLGGERILVHTKKVIRAADFLVRERAVLAQREAAEYARSCFGRHIVNFAGQKPRSVEFIDLQVRDVDVKAWKARGKKAGTGVQPGCAG
ncbi:BTB/POZ domain-containing protein 3-like [Paramacrobiotus metropolitanus]|uniref:BTB/POZ domain-containing protein 3-like n=1 Tax=Paramacrobiotus metropolitanus TaxID=2943436 RepID=UPI0024465BDA|nr:BTB/POZ domain-containing protein 3-like [Paramacrobiotus metropolitanus]